jgi:protein-S-isoprenylcysteine O-methyltransferase Ste14
MNTFLRIALPAYFLLFGTLVFAGISLRVWIKTGKSPLVLPRDDSAQALIGFYLKLVWAILGLYVIAYAFIPGSHEPLFPLPGLQHRLFAISGSLLMGFALIWTVIAQLQMKNAWRIGIDSDQPSPLVTHGLFSFSRNPVFLGMLGSLAGLLLATPNALTLMLLIVACILIQIQIRLEEEHLNHIHGRVYQQYRLSVRRFL